MSFSGSVFAASITARDRAVKVGGHGQAHGRPPYFILNGVEGGQVSFSACPATPWSDRACRS